MSTIAYEFWADEWHADYRGVSGSGDDKWWALRHLQDKLAGGEFGIAFELGEERYENRYYGKELRNPQIYPRQFIEGWEHAIEKEQDRWAERHSVESYYDQ